MDAAFQFRAFEDMLRSLSQRVAQLERRQPSSKLFEFTPAILGSTTNPDLGAGGIAIGQYQIAHARCFWRATITFAGAGLSAGSGDYALVLNDLPSSPDFGFGQVGSGWYYSSGGFNVVTAEASTQFPLTLRMIGEGGIVGAAFPATPTNGSVLSLHGDYPVA